MRVNTYDRTPKKPFLRIRSFQFGHTFYQRTRARAFIDIAFDKPNMAVFTKDTMAFHHFPEDMPSFDELPAELPS